MLGQADLLVNTTSLGMKGEPPLALALDDLPERAIVADIVYVPLETPLLAAARARGLRTADGLGMLLHQAVPGFEAWFGTRPRVTPELRALVEADVMRGA
jgi:shikimate dehydrogenase